jgi:diguanylate cyclase (GGDEF)-like protein
MELTADLGFEVPADHEVFHVIPEQGVTDDREWSFVRKDGSQLPVQLVVSALKDHAGETIGFLDISYDLTERKRADEYIYHAANHDPLTGLPTRTLLRDRLDVAIERAKRSLAGVAVMIVDLDDFKRVNDSLGHQAGDTMLCEVAQRLRDCVRKSDTVARMGGDEFVVLLPDLTAPSGVEEIASKLLEAISRPLRIGRHDVSVTASIGISMFPDGADIDTLFKNADLAMYRAKARGRNGVKLFTPGLGMESLQKVQMESALRGAIEGREFEIVYQPQISFDDNRMIGVEALLRWHSPEFGTVMPNVFIPLAEETGLIIPIGEWILKTACREVAALQSELHKDTMLAVNISPRQFQQKNFPVTIEEAIRESGLRPEQLELEITEQLLMMDSEESLEIMRRVRTLGVRFAIDDFGTGFSNMGYITRFAVDRIKIDRSFICKCDTDSNSRAVTSAIIALAHSLEIEVIAEGVETTKHVEMLTTMQCDQAQGYLYSRPLKLPSLKRFSAKAIVLPRISTERSGIRRAFNEISKDTLHPA